MADTTPKYRSHFTAAQIDEAVAAGNSGRLLDRSVFKTRVLTSDFTDPAPYTYKYALQGVYGVGDVNINSGNFDCAPSIYLIDDDGNYYTLDYTLYENNNVKYADITLNTKVNGYLYEIGTLLSGEEESEITTEYNIEYRYHNYYSNTNYILSTSVNTYKYKSSTPLPTTATATVGNDQVTLNVIGWIQSDEHGDPTQLDDGVFPSDYVQLNETPYNASGNLILYAIIENNIAYSDFRSGYNIINNTSTKYYYPVDIGHNVSIISNPFDVSGINTVNNVYITGWRALPGDTTNINGIVIDSNSDGIVCSQAVYLNGIDTTNESLVYAISGQSATITSSGQISDQIVIPHYLGNYPVNTIGQSAFIDQTNPTTILFTDYITSIDASAFNGCTSLISFNLPQHLISIGTSAFAGCSDMVSFSVPDSVTVLSDSVLENCTSLSTLSLGNGITVLSNGLLRNCSSLASLVIGDGITSIGNNTLSGCTGLTHLSIGNGVTSIGNNAFSDCRGIQTLSIGNGVTTLGAGMLSGCSALQSLTIPFVGSSISATTETDNTLFGYIFGSVSYSGASSTRQVYYDQNGNIHYAYYYIPDSLIDVAVTGGTIWSGAFSYCRYLRTVTLNDTITGNKIGACAFEACSALTSVSLASVITQIDTYAFRTCDLLSNINLEDVIYIGSYAFDRCGSLESINLENVRYIEDHAFVNAGLSTIYIMSNPTIYRYAFYGVNTPLSVYSKSTSVLTSIMNKNTGSQDTHPVTDSSTQYKMYLLDNGTSYNIYNNGYWNNTPNLILFSKPDNVSIERGALSGCSGLRTLIMRPESYGYSGGVKQVYTNIGELFGTTSYTGSTAITQRQYIDGSSYSSYEFTYYIPTNLNTIIASRVGRGGLMNCTMIRSAEVSYAGQYAFKNCSGLSDVDITYSVGVSTIDGEAFNNCTSLESIIIPNNITSIGQQAFRDCNHLTSVTLPESLVTVNSQAFYGCKINTLRYNGTLSQWLSMSDLSNVMGLAIDSATPFKLYINNDLICGNIIIPNNINIISAYAFYRCQDITSVTLHENIRIDNYAFATCYGLTSITIPSNTTINGSSVFFGCYSLIEVYNQSQLNIVAGSESYGYVAKYAQNVYTVSGGSKLSIDQNGYVIYTDNQDVLLVKYQGNGINLTLPNNITQINDYAFYQNDNIVSVSASNLVTKVGNFVFRYCANLSNVILPASVLEIASYAFANCGSLISISLSNSIISIGSMALYYCLALEDINYSGTMADWNNISLSSSWNSYTGNYVIHCTDGDIPKS